MDVELRITPFEGLLNDLELAIDFRWQGKGIL